MGILVGSASMVLVVTASLSGGRYVLEQIESVGSNLVHTEHVKTGDQTSTLSDGHCQVVRATRWRASNKHGPQRRSSEISCRGSERRRLGDDVPLLPASAHHPAIVGG